MNSWERQLGESAVAFQAFVTYREMGVERSITKAAQKLGKSRTVLEAWSRKWAWVARIEAYERYLDQEATKVKLKIQRDMLEMHANIATTALKLVARKLTKMATKDEDFKATDLAKILSEAAKIERMSRGLPAEVVAQQHEHQTQVPWASLPLEKKIALREIMKTLLGARH